MRDERAIKILLDTFWSPTGWRDNRTLAPQDLAYAKNAGVMFDPVALTHDRTIEWALEARKQVRARDVTEGFLASLSTRRLEIRSALASFSLLKNLKRHAFVQGEGDRQCQICGGYKEDEHDLNVLNFERHKWGGVRHDHVEYAAFDLERLALMDWPTATEEDIRIFREVLHVAEAMPAKATPEHLNKAWAKTLAANKAERDVLMQILGISGILSTKEHPGFHRRFVPAHERELPPYRFADRGYPTAWWRGRDGVNRQVVKDLFGWTGAV